MALLRSMDDRTASAEQYASVAANVDEQGRRVVAATEALSVGRRAIIAVSRSTRLLHRAISRAARERGRPGTAGWCGGARRWRTQGLTQRADLE